MIDAPFRITPKVHWRVVPFSNLPRGRHFLFIQVGPDGKEQMPVHPDHIYTKTDQSFAQPLDGGERFIVSWRRLVCEIILVVEPIRDQPTVNDVSYEVSSGLDKNWALDDILRREG